MDIKHENLKTEQIETYALQADGDRHGHLVQDPRDAADWPRQADGSASKGHQTDEQGIGVGVVIKRIQKDEVLVKTVLTISLVIMKMLTKLEDFFPQE